MLSYNKLLRIYNDTNYPFNLINNLKDNIISTKNEIELEYIKDFNIFKDKDKNKDNIQSKKNEFKIGGSNTKKIYIYEY